MYQPNSLLKFCECFTIDPNFYNADKSSESYYIQKGIDIEAFKKMMYQYDMESFTFIIICYFTEVYGKEKISDSVLEYIESENEINIEKQYEIDLTKALLFQYSSLTDSNLSVTFNKSRNSITIQNQSIVKHLANELYKEFKRKEYQKVNLTYKEAKEEMLLDDEHKIHVYTEQNFGTNEEPDIQTIEFEQAIDLYAETHTKEQKITAEFLENKLKKLSKDCKRKKGAKIKNSGLANMCENLSFLIRLKKFYSQNDTEYICDIPLSNKDCRFIYACLAFFNIIEDNSENRSKTNPENYIRSILKQKQFNTWLDEDFFGSKIYGIFDLKEKLLK